MTIPGLVAVSLGDCEKEHGLTFVALSRSAVINNVFLGPGCSLERLTTKISNGLKLKQILVEDIRLQMLDDQTCAHYEMNWILFYCA